MRKLVIFLMLWAHNALAQVPAYPPAPGDAPNLTGAEYFINTDPGFGMGMAIPASAALDLPALLGSINTSNLPVGSHRLYVRTRNETHHWSITNSIVFGVFASYPNATPEASVVEAAEYFINSDPGFGMGNPIPVSASLDLPALLGTINTSTLPVGSHRLYVRTRNAAHHWSLTSSIVFGVFAPYPEATPEVSPVVAAEYFVNNDPGFGNGHSIPVTAALDIPGLMSGIQTVSLDPGIHRLYVRTRSNTGGWSLTGTHLFGMVSPYPNAPSAPGNITEMEYFVDADPGFGNGTPISFTSATDVSNLVFPVNTAILAPGPHHLFVRSKNTWGLTNYIPFEVEGTLPLKLIGFNAAKRGNGVQLLWDTQNESNVSHFELERSKNGSDFESLGRVAARNGASNRYQYTDGKPWSQLNYYRLKMVDRDGTFRYSEVRSVLFTSYGQEIQVVPNPATSIVRVTLAAMGEEKASLQIYNQQGAQVRTVVADFQNQLKIPVADLPAGMYYIQISTGSSIYHARFIKQ